MSLGQLDAEPRLRTKGPHLRNLAFRCTRQWCSIPSPARTRDYPAKRAQYQSHFDILDLLTLSNLRALHLPLLKNLFSIERDIQGSGCIKSSTSSRRSAASVQGRGS
ncbi:hypothetical protein HGRIS_012080 [Hohenbuehelia grisea]|uniref:Uncharacterized protein n=1 Tax=Hohenbuehelia grisea TaxID=104357 RepID=A0ABR3IR94_9AGAR